MRNKKVILFGLFLFAVGVILAIGYNYYLQGECERVLTRYISNDGERVSFEIAGNLPSNVRDGASIRSEIVGTSAVGNIFYAENDQRQENDGYVWYYGNTAGNQGWVATHSAGCNEILAQPVLAPMATPTPVPTEVPENTQDPNSCTTLDPFYPEHYGSCVSFDPHITDHHFAVGWCLWNHPERPQNSNKMRIAQFKELCEGGKSIEEQIEDKVTDFLAVTGMK